MKNWWIQNEGDKWWEDNVEEWKQIENVIASQTELWWMGEREDTCTAFGIFCSAPVTDPNFSETDTENQKAEPFLPCKPFLQPDSIKMLHQLKALTFILSTIQWTYE